MKQSDLLNVSPLCGASICLVNCNLYLEEEQLYFHSTICNATSGVKTPFILHYIMMCWFRILGLCLSRHVCM